MMKLSDKMGSCRFALNDHIAVLAQKDPTLTFITCDNTSDRSVQQALSDVLGERYLDCGIAEQNAVGIASGLALSGKKVILQTFASFLSLRSIEQIYLDCCYNRAGVVLMGTHSGVTACTAGPTHGALLDYGFLRCMPNMTVFVPSDPAYCASALEALLALDGPSYIRVAKGKEHRVYQDDAVPFKLGRCITVCPGTDVTLIGCGCGVWHCLQAAGSLEKEGISARVLDMHTIHPIDQDAIVLAANETNGIVVCEDHMISGGLGTAVCEVTASLGLPAPVYRLGIPDCFYSQGDMPEEIYSRYGYDSAGVIRAAHQILSRKGD